jgi:branched-chain amino acid transport system ATP-binding protein
MLKVENLNVFHGLIEAVHGISLTVPVGQCVSLLGPNGAGKTSTISAITGVAKSTGSISFENNMLTGLSTEDRIKAGISLSPEGRRVFANLTVDENLVLGGGLKPVGRSERIQSWYETFPILGERKNQPAGTLSGGEQQMLAIARALMNEPKILLLDEPSLGLAPKIVSQIFGIIQKLKNEKRTILLVEQNATQALRISDYAYFLNNGHIIAEGHPNDLGEREDLMAELTGIG